MFIGENKNHTGRQLLIYGYLFMHRNMRDEVNFSLEELIQGCGSSLNRHIGKTNELYYQDLKYIIEQNKSGHFNITTKKVFKQINLTDRIILYLGDIVIDGEKHTQLTFEEYDIITTSDYIRKDNLLITYLYLKSHFFERKLIKDEHNKIIGEEGTPKDNPVGYAIDYKNISTDIGLSINTVISAINYLYVLKLLYVYKTGGYKNDKGKIQNAPNIYTPWDRQNEAIYVLDKLKEKYKVDKFYEIKKESRNLKWQEKQKK